MENFDYPLSPRVQGLKEKRRRINKDLRLDFERNRIITEYYKTHMKEYPILKRAGYLYTWLTTREINIDDDDIFLGDSGPRCRSVHFDIEQTPAAWIEGCFGDTDERFKAAWQVPGSVWVSDEDRAWALEAVEFWKDNDIAATDYTIGLDTATNTVLTFTDSLRATCESHARCSVIEVMGRHAGHIALRTAVAAGAVAVAVAEFKFDEDAVIKMMIEKRKAGKRSFLIVVSEGLPGYAEKLAKTVEEKTGIVTRFCCPAHVQRGGIPTLTDRLVASEMGEYAVKLLMDGKSDVVICKNRGELCTVDISRALKVDRMLKGKLTDEERRALTPDELSYMEARCAEVKAQMKALYDLVYAIN